MTETGSSTSHNHFTCVAVSLQPSEKYLRRETSHDTSNFAMHEVFRKSFNMQRVLCWPRILQLRYSTHRSFRARVVSFNLNGPGGHTENRCANNIYMAMLSMGITWLGLNQIYRCLGRPYTSLAQIDWPSNRKAQVYACI